MTTAEVSLHDALQGDPENWEVRLALLCQLRDRNDQPSLLRVLSEAAVPPDSEKELRQVVEICAQAKAPGAALPILKAFLNAHPKSAVGHYLYAKLLYKMGDLNRAREYYNAAVNLNSELEDEVLAAKLTDLGETMSHSLPRSEVGALATLHKTGRIQPLPDRDQSADSERVSAPEESEEPGTPAQPPLVRPLTAPSAQPVAPSKIASATPKGKSRILAQGQVRRDVEMAKANHNPAGLLLAILIALGLLAALAFAMLRIPL